MGAKAIMPMNCLNLTNYNLHKQLVEMHSLYENRNLYWKIKKKKL